MRFVGSVIAFLLWVAVPVAAHSDHELEEWSRVWTVDMADALEAEDPGRVADLLLDRADMAERHPCQMTICEPVVRATRLTATLPGPVRVSPGVEQWRTTVQAYFLAEYVDSALSVMDCESGGDPGAKNPVSTAAGLFQFLRGTWDRTAVVLGYGPYDSGAVYDPVANIHAASVLSKGGSTWQQWSCKP